MKLIRMVFAAAMGLAACNATPLALGLGSASAALGDYCFIESTLQPGEEDNGGLCQATDPADGFDCGNSLFYNQSAGQCVANNATCTASGGAAGSYSGGICQPLPQPPTATEPAAPGGFVLDPTAGGIPSGELQPMCVNASPFIGGGMFVVSGTVLCYEGAGRPTGIYAYTDNGGNQSGWNVLDPDRPTWDSLTLTDLYASDDITAQGALSVFGGAQIYAPNGLNGFQVNNTGVLIRSADGTGPNANIATIQTKPGNVSVAATNGTTTSSVDVNGDTGVGVVGTRDTGGPGVNISGSVGATSTARTGVRISGDGQGAQVAPTSGPADWADSLIASKSFTLDNGLGSGVWVNDYGVTIKSASIGNSFNAFGSASANSAGSVLTNVMGDGGAGTVNNIIGRAGNTGTVVTNDIGTAGNGGSTVNRIGNTNALTTFSATAGTSSMTVIQGALDFVTGQGASTLPSPTQLVDGGNATSMVGSSSRHAEIDENGRVTMVNRPATEASSATYITNGYGTTNAVVVTERSAVMSGGERNPTTLTLSDTGAHYGNSTTGAPVRISGVADGEGAFEAVNVRQLHSGLASVVALTGLPTPAAGKRNSFGIAYGHHGSGSAVALGGQSLLGEAFTFKYGASVAEASGRLDSSMSVGLGVSW